MATTFLLDPANDLTASVARFRMGEHKRQYKDKQYEGGETEWKKKYEIATTVYVGNLSCYTTEFQLYELFGRCGSIKRIIMGLHRTKKTPCGFCFVEFDERDAALKSIQYLNKTRLDGREISINLDAGFKEGRQYGRGSQGGQIGDERKTQREQQGAAAGPPGGGQLFTRSITIVTCLALISILMIGIDPVVTGSTNGTIVLNNAYSSRNFHFNRHSNQFINPLFIRQAQLGQQREQFEKAFAQFLVNIMKTAKPTLLKAFMRATLDDKQLKEIAIGLFFNNTSTDD